MAPAALVVHRSATLNPVRMGLAHQPKHLLRRLDLKMHQPLHKMLLLRVHLHLKILHIHTILSLHQQIRDSLVVNLKDRDRDSVLQLHIVKVSLIGVIAQNLRLLEIYLVILEVV